MTVDEALRELSMHLIQCGALMPIDWLSTHGEGSRFMEAYGMALDALKTQEGNEMQYNTYFDLRYAPPGMTDEEKLEMAREVAVRDLARLLVRKGEFKLNHEGNCVLGVIRIETE